MIFWKFNPGIYEKREPRMIMDLIEEIAGLIFGLALIALGFAPLWLPYV
jgi:hypothetical protein